ncbi:MAG: hypothetical protein JWM25_1673 [Thermoleophilia bacterium]|nr:hypothetical protein [Thermoleophilia bacterium]MCZ4497088.1 hypothetical protein [Thermoleophilia bacterium]
MSIAAAGIESFASIAGIRAAAPRVAGTAIEFKGGFTGNADGGVMGDIAAFAGAQGPIFGDKLSVLGPIAGIEKLFGGGAQRYSGHDATIHGVLELLGDLPVLTHAKIISPQG